jgi:putative DNA primase/helicase
MAGTFLIDDILDHGMYLLLGPESTGKGTFAESLMKVLGNKENGIAIVPDSKLFSAKDDHPTALTDLRGRRMAWIDEMEFGGSLSESRLKRLTGDEDISARKMRENNSTFAAGHTFLVTTNAPLRATGDPAVWRRLRYIPFEVPVSGALSVATKNAAAGEEAAGILAWMAEGARRVLENPDLLKRLPPAADRLTRELNGESNHIADFVETMLTRLPAPVDAKDRRGMSATELRLLCSTWCRDNRYPVLDARTLGKRLADLHVATVGPRQNVEGEKVRIYRVLSKHDLRAHLPFVPDPAGTEGGG